LSTGAARIDILPDMIQLDHIMVPARDKKAAAKLIAELLGVPWGESPAGPFTAVYVNDSLTLDFDEWTQPFEPLHFAFRVSDGEFDAILERVKKAGIPLRSGVHGPVDGKVGEWNGGRLFYWNEPDGHHWELLTKSYAREPK
jgi:catechol 2,3-dioxygenase-like lactoylglutathione lyase family enzyme